MSNLEVTKAPAAELARCISTQILAFAADPLMRWALPDPERYVAFFPTFLQHYGGQAFELGTAYRTQDYRGSAHWLPPGVGFDQEALGAVVQEAVAPERLDEVFGVLEAVGKAHPEEPHWFLPVIGVDPSCQSRGYGSALLERSLAAVDADHRVAYLEASNPRSVPLYQRFGFEVIDEIQVGTSPPVVPMRRAAR
jgi:ribosomal protein S18 acetylase RimI-like enzyme